MEASNGITKRRKRETPPSPPFQQLSLSEETEETSNVSLIFDQDHKNAKNIIILVILLSFLFFSAMTGSWLHHRLPPPKPPTVEDFIFSEGRVMNHLRPLTKMGAKLVGGEVNEKQVPQFLLSRIEKEKKFLESRDPSLPSINLEIDIQKPSGSFYLEFLNDFTNVYQNVTNIVVRLSFNSKSKSSTPRPALLISAHFDGALGSPAASDDEINIAIMLELLHVFVHLDTQSIEGFGQNDLIFLFNGAEETILQASHGFITQHRWAKDIKAFINLEAAGSGGQELVFQTGPQHGWLAFAYARSAPYPHGSILAQEIFQSGVIPSDTDFRIYRDHGFIPGIDIAFIANGYAYHTRLDTVETITEGSAQRCGENVLETIKYILKNNLLVEHFMETESAVYYDVFGSITLCYSHFFAFIFHSILIAIVTYYLVKQRGFEKMKKGGYLLLSGWGMGVLCTIIVCLGLTFLKPMSWFSKPYLIPLIFGLPTLFGILISHFFLAPAPKPSSSSSSSRSSKIRANDEPFHNSGEKIEGEVSGSSRMEEEEGRVEEVREDGIGVGGSKWAGGEMEESVFAGSLCFWTFFCLVLTLSGSGSGYLPFLWILFPFLPRFIFHSYFSSQNTINSNYNNGLPSKQLLFILFYLFCLLLPTIDTIRILLVVINFFGPLTGRIGNLLIPDLLIGIPVSLFFCILSSYSISLIHFVELDKYQKRNILKLISIVFICCVLIGLIGLPYSDLTPKRMFVQQTLRLEHAKDGTVINQNSGYFINSFDYLHVQPLHRLQINYIEQAKPCDFDGPSQGLPWYFPLMGFAESVWYEGPTYEETTNPTLKLVRSEPNPKQNYRELFFELRGPSIMNVYIANPWITEPIHGTSVRQILDWSVYNMTLEEVYKRKKEEGKVYDGMDEYFFFFAAGGDSDNLSKEKILEFSVKVRNYPVLSNKVNDVRIAFACQYPPGNPYIDDEVRDCWRFPEWIAGICWKSSYRSFIF